MTIPSDAREKIPRADLTLCDSIILSVWAFSSIGLEKFCSATLANEEEPSLRWKCKQRVDSPVHSNSNRKCHH